MIVGQCSFCFTQASRSSFLSARDSDWNKLRDVESESENKDIYSDENSWSLGWYFLIGVSFQQLFPFDQRQ